MPQNLCSPTNVFGGTGVNQTLFLGLSISQFSSSCGWSGQVSELSVVLAQDPCVSPPGKFKVYYDENLNPQTTTAADGTFLGEGSNAIIGSPAYFRFGNFEYSGIIQSWTKDENNNVYTVKLVDPRQVLEGTQLIIGEYSGGVGNTYNTVNIYGFMESFGVDSPLYYQNSPSSYVPGDSGPDGATFGTFADGFGGSNSNTNGMQWSRILDGINVLLNSNPIIGNVWSPFGRMVYKGPIGASSYGLMAADTGNLCQYFVDLSELPAMPSEWRIQGSSITLMDAITLVCEEAGYEFYCELIPVQAALSSSGITKFIKIRTVNRATQPSLGAIDDFINGVDGGVVNSSIGRELRNEVTSAFVIGGSKQTIYQIDQSLDPELDGQPTGNPELDDVITPFFGFDDDGNAIMPQKDSEGFWEFRTSTLGLSTQLQSLTFESGGNPVYSAKINERELLFALAGYDQWMSYSTTEPKTEIAQLAFPDDLIGLFDLTTIVELMKNPNANQKTFPKDLINAIQKVVLGNRTNLDNNLQHQDLQNIYDWVLGIAREYYGRKFMVRVPYTSGKLDTVSNQLVTSEQPSDGGWTEFSTVIGLENPGIYLDFFRLDDSRIRPFVKFNNAETKSFVNLDVSDYLILYGSNNQDYTSDTDIVEDLIDSGTGVYNVKGWVKVETEQEYVYKNRFTLESPRVLVSLAGPVLDINDTASAANGHIHLRGITKLAEKMILTAGDKANFKGNFDALLNDIGSIETYFMVDFLPCMPDSAAIALRSNSLTYGPWYNPGPPGQTRIESDPELVPWNYNGIATMNAAGQAMANQGLTSLQVVEMGSIEVPGYPTIPLGAEIGALAGGFYGGGSNLIENRSVANGTFSDTHHDSGAYSVNYAFFDYSGEWTGLYGPNITDISFGVGENGFTTTYGLRTYTPKVGRFAKYNADRLKLLAKQQMEINKLTSSREFRSKTLGLLGQRESLKYNINTFNKQGKTNTSASPHEVLVGQEKIWGDDGSFRRVSVVSETVSEIANEFYNLAESSGTGENPGYKALMTLDGLLRPVYSSEMTSETARANSQPPQPPVFRYDQISNTGVPDYGDAAYRTTINASYLNPTLNTGDNKHLKSGDDDCGHDIDMLGKLTAPEYSMSIPIEEYMTGTGGYAASYNYLGLRGPIILKGWGYDTNGKPVPNRTTDEEIETGTIGYQDYFAENWLQKQNTWPSGPIDLRWDRSRGVWVCPQNYRLVNVKLLSNLNPFSETFDSGTRATGILEQTTDLYDKDGNLLDPNNTSSRPTVIIHDKIGLSATAGSRLWAYWDEYEQKYYALNNVVTYGSSGCNETGILENELNFSPYSRILYGPGLSFDAIDSGTVLIDTVPFRVSHDIDPDISGQICWDLNESGWIDLDNTNFDVKTIMFGPGMIVQTLDDSGTGCNPTVRVDMNLKIDGYITGEVPYSKQHRLKLDFSEDFVLSDIADCGVRVGLRSNNGFTGNIGYIKTVSCDESGGLNVLSGELMFDNGILTGDREI